MGVKFLNQGNARGSSVPATPNVGSRALYAPRMRIAAQAPDTKILLSVLVPTVPGREHKLAKLLAVLDSQIAARSDVELLVLRDNRSMTIGEKRNRMLAISRGAYVAFVDDDDEVMSDYVSSIAPRLAESPDVLCFDVVVHGHGAPKTCYYSLAMSDQNLPDRYHRKPNHLMVWRRELAVACPFPSVKTGEDTAWANQICSRATKEIHVPRTLYSYNYDPADNSATPRPAK
jgi:hypothetical protein